MTSGVVRLAPGGLLERGLRLTPERSMSEDGAPVSPYRLARTAKYVDLFLHDIYVQEETPEGVTWARLSESNHHPKYLFVPLGDTYIIRTGWAISPAPGFQARVEVNPRLQMMGTVDIGTMTLDSSDTLQPWEMYVKVQLWEPFRPLGMSVDMISQLRPAQITSMMHFTTDATYGAGEFLLRIRLETV